MNLLKATVLASLMAVSVGGMVRAHDSEGQISVVGAGRITAVPDMATIMVGVTHEAQVAGAAMQAVSVSVAQVLVQMSTKGIDARDIQTQRLTLNPVWSDRSSSASQRAKITGFVASNSVLVRVRDLDRLGEILEAVIADGANEFNGLRFSVQDPEPLIKDARRKAVADAMSRASQLAEAAGVDLGEVKSMTEQGGNRPRPMAMEAARSSVPVAPGEITLSVSVSMVFEIDD